MSQASVQLLEPDAAWHEATEALAIHAHVHDPRAACAAHMSLCVVGLTRGEVETALDHGRRAVGLAESARQTGDSFPAAELIQGLALLDADRLGEAEAMLRAGREQAGRRGLASQVPPYHWALVGTHFFAGRWDDAIAEAEAGLELVEETKIRAGVLVAHTLLSRIHFSRGDLAAAEAHAGAGQAEFMTTGPAVGLDLLLWSRALLLEGTVGPAAALAVLGGVWDLATPMRYLLAYRSIGPDLVRVAVAVGDEARARAVTEEVETGARQFGAPTSLGAALRCRTRCWSAIPPFSAAPSRPIARALDCTTGDEQPRSAPPSSST